MGFREHVIASHGLPDTADLTALADAFDLDGLDPGEVKLPPPPLF